MLEITLCSLSVFLNSLSNSSFSWGQLCQLIWDRDIPQAHLHWLFWDKWQELTCGKSFIQWCRKLRAVNIRRKSMRARTQPRFNSLPEGIGFLQISWVNEQTLLASLMMRVRFTQNFTWQTIKLCGSTCQLYAQYQGTDRIPFWSEN